MSLKVVLANGTEFEALDVKAREVMAPQLLAHQHNTLTINLGMESLLEIKEQLTKQNMQTVKVYYSETEKVEHNGYVNNIVVETFLSAAQRTAIITAIK